MDENSDADARHIDTYPLLMEQHSSSAAPEHSVVNVEPEASNSGNAQHHQHLQQGQLSQRNGDAATAPPSSSSSSSRSTRNYSIPRQRISPLNSGLWISIELTITVSQIVASIIVLSLSRDEKPQAPLSVWVAGYAAGCLATLPLLYWRYTHRNGTTQAHDQHESPSQSTPSAESLPPSPRGTSYVALNIPSASTEVVEPRARSRGRDVDSASDNSGVGRLVEKFKIALDCFFAVWFVVGNVWIFGGHSSSREAPNLYRLCIVFLTFSCIGYAMPFILCATICCCLPCIIALLGFREEQAQNRGASAEVIAALPTYKFKSRPSSESKDGSESDSEGSNEGGFVAAGTDKERAVSADDAVCCICLARYRDGEPLRELSCTHHFHVDCVDKWLKINASCPLCKLDVGGANDQSGNAAGNEASEARAA
ncbi:E3 ubiquitin-protein ligase At1g63170 isoform X1 [Selaginella moellendorffii]|uniref:E3 ubiquitin-protein ligase At1g63170 isoform X1 n=1 Tax=Selaginella moellendorffii TaxID=88036 RepID=UPI000D1C3546|nr:E3 ubiquitin-protein ligase At1g63170 isoform X1 [Selaginella moellendorffii]|eukprot:XP_024541343.1 E3 ubiquitin-protein ligase At1g63170 isoform X1 [Selaginella moellendorffii]